MNNSYTIEQAAFTINHGGVVAFPTETVYGLGASVFLENAIKKVFLLKKRPQDNPLIIHISNLSQLSLIAESVPDLFFKLAEAFFPGPLTILLPKKESVPSIVSAHLSTVGVRMPAHSIAQQLIEAVGSPLVAPSANLSGKPSSTTAQHVLDDFGDGIEILDGGPCQYGIESTVIALSPTPQILRPGAITQEQLEEVLKLPVSYANEKLERPLSPGMKYRHYAPQARILTFHSDDDLKAYISLHPLKKRTVLSSLCCTTLYASFRQADQEGKEEILILCNDSARENLALMNRISRASQ